MKRTHHTYYVAGLIACIVGALEHEPIVVSLGTALVFVWVYHQRKTP